MINKIKIYDNVALNPYHNLAIEEYLTMHVDDSELIVYLWQNEHTIVIGRNQNVWQECKTNIPNGKNEMKTVELTRFC